MEAGPFAGRRLHFVGIGGAGMSGLALVAASWGRRCPARTGRTPPTPRACARPASSRGRATTSPRPREPSSWCPPPSPGQPRAGARPRGRRAGPPPRRPAGRGHGAEAHDRGGRHPRQDHHRVDGRARARSTTGRDPAFLIGGELRAAGTNAGWGAGEWAVVEADESDRSFLKLAREVAVVTSVELDHHATYRSLAEVESAFDEFAAPADLRVLGPGVQLPGAGAALSYGIDAGDLRAEDVELLPLGSRFTVDGRARRAGGARAPQRAERPRGARGLPARGRGAGGGRRRRWPASPVRGGASRITAGPRRGARVFDDYAHHPTEVRATLEAARTLAPGAPGGGASSRTSTRAPVSSRASSGARSRWRTSWWCSTSTRRASAPRTSRA